MGRGGNPNGGVHFQGEVFRAGEVPAATLSRAERAGEVRRLTRGVYTTNTTASLEDVTRRNLWRIIGMLVPGAVITDRSIRTPNRAAVDGNLYVASPDVSVRGRSVKLPGVTLQIRRGHGAAPDDIPIPGGIFLASTARGLLDNARLTRGRGTRVSPTLNRRELEEWLEALLDERGEERFLELRDQARRLASILGLQEEFRLIDALTGAVLGTRDVKAQSPLLQARQKGLPYDARRVELFEAVYDELDALAPRPRPSDPRDARTRFLPFFEAYFSNYIEGTEFTVDEAKDIVFGGAIPVGRPEDARDILSTYALVADEREMRRLPESFEDYLELLRARHRRMFDQRPEVQPGEFKVRANRAGTTEFVDPARVKGTLAKGYALYQSLADPFARAAFQMFLVAEVHPFKDGNGRMARLMMNAELVAAGEARIIIPTVYRTEYLGSLRALSNLGNTAPLPRVLDFAQRYTHAIDFSDFDRAITQLDATKAFVDYTASELEGARLRMPQVQDSESAAPVGASEARK